MAEGGEIVDQLPEDLQPELVDRSEYIFPNNSQRRSPGYLYMGIGAVALCVSIVASRSAFINPGIILGALAIGLFGVYHCLLYTSPSPRDQRGSRMPSSA